MKRLFFVAVILFNVGCCNAQNSTSFLEKFINGIVSLLSSSYEEGGTLTQEMIDSAGASFTVSGEYTLEGKTLVLPKDFTLVFKGGKLDNGEIKGNSSAVQASSDNEIFGLNLKIVGTWKVPEIYDTWFAFDTSEDFVSNNTISNILALADDSYQNHIYFKKGRTYYFEMPYKGRADLGEMVSYTIKNGSKSRKYSELINDDYSYLRIFTIPSNTQVTVNATLQMLPTNQGAYFVFWEFGKKNITIDGNGSINGEVENHLYTDPFAGKKYYGEFGHIFMCQKCHDITFKNITIAGAFGDCVLYRGSLYDDEKDDRWATNLVMDNVTIKKARRNGVAVAARNVRITNCHFEGCGTDEIKGTNPNCGIDFETDKLSKYPELGNQNVVMDNCSFKDNKLDVASVHNNTSDFGKVATTITNCNFTAPIKINTTHWITFKNCSIPFFYDPKSSKSQFLYCRHLTFEDCEFGEIESSCIKNAKKVSVTIKNCKY